MTRTRRKAHTRIAPEGVVAEMRGRVPRLVARIATAIQLEVDAYAGPVLGARRKLLETALRAGLREFLDRVSGKARPSTEVNELFRTMGRAEALDGHTLESMRCAYDVATREVWEEVHHIALSHALPTSILGRLGDALFEQVGHLRDEVESGHRAGIDELNSDLRFSRENLALQLLDGAEMPTLESMAATATWLLPDLITVVCARLPDGMTLPEQGSFQVDALVASDSPYALLLCDARVSDDLVREARATFGCMRLAVSLAMPPTQVDAAARLAKRAHQLAEERVIQSIGIVDCADHEVLLWLHSEPILRDRLASRLLAPIAAETPHRRRMLALTLLIWLERRASAPAIAEHLGVHPQTVRHRLRQLDSMFDGRLGDPDLAFPTLLALKATLPSWLASLPDDL